jgi:DNA-binding MarR family transcriptional regulator
LRKQIKYTYFTIEENDLDKGVGLLGKDRDELRNLAYGVFRLVQEFKLAQEQRKDLDRVTFEILMLIKSREQIRPSDIAHALDLNPSSITRRIPSLQQAGYISVVTDSSDLRSSLIRLTETGEEVLACFLERSVDGLDMILQDWSAEEARELSILLPRLADTLHTWRLKDS